ncbi:MAG: alpha-amylase family glycosyl hydrolase [Bacteroidales bacterium]
MARTVAARKNRPEKTRTALRIAGILVLGTLSCTRNVPSTTTVDPKEMKINVYQVFTRLFGNTNTTNTPWGTRDENGVGKFSDFDDRALEAIKDLGITHIWYTGVLHHALVTDYSSVGLPGDDPDVVKGRAGSPYSVKDYYNVNPDLADDPARRLEEFEALVARTHAHGMKVIIDIVPNHVARVYHSVSNPPGAEDFGASDDVSREYLPDNNFYYIPGQAFRVPQWRDGYRVLGGEPHPGADGRFREDPAKWTGNGSRSPQPDMFDWYEAVKINFGVRPDGGHDFPSLPEGYGSREARDHLEFWKGRDVPDSWKKFRDIALYWLDRGVDGFRYDMAEMVPVEFWSYLNSAIKDRRPDAFLLAEIYQPHIYRDYIRLGKMDYLYDKVQLYDSLKAVMQGHGSTDAFVHIQNDLADIAPHMLHFLENHDEQRIASPEFAGDARLGLPAMVLSATISSAPTMLYFGQHVGEPGAERAGFGSPGRTSIFDYIGVPRHQQWMNNGAFDGGQLDEPTRALHEAYRKILRLALESPALTGEYMQIHSHNRQYTDWYNDRVFSFLRWNGEEKLLIVCNFDARDGFGFDLELPEGAVSALGLQPGSLVLEDLLGDTRTGLEVHEKTGKVRIDLAPLQSVVYRILPV